jgi:hypothetical protein
MEPTSVFYTHGAIQPECPHHYVEREADKDIMLEINRGGYIQLCLAPHQMGKTSLFYSVKKRLQDAGWNCCYVDLSTLSGMKQTEWLPRLEEKIAVDWDLDSHRITEQEALDFEHFLLVRAGLKKEQVRLALFLDEIAALLELDFARRFLMILRDLYQRRNEYRGRLLVMVGGTASPSLLSQSQNSPFHNVAVDIVLEDFNWAEHATLTARLGLLGVEVEDAVPAQIYDWVRGQPYLTQRICELIEQKVCSGFSGPINKDLIDELVQGRLLSNMRRDANISSMMNKIAQLDGPAAKLWQRIAAGERASSKQAGFSALYLSGAVTEAPDGSIVVRNRVYREVLGLSGAVPGLALGQTPAGQAPASQMLGRAKRLEDLEKLIIEAGDLLSEYEEKHLYESDPKEKRRIEKEIAELKERLAVFEREVSQIRATSSIESQQVTAGHDDDVLQRVETRLAQIHSSIETGFSEQKQWQMSMVERLESNHFDQLAEIRLLLKDGKVEKDEAAAALDDIRVSIAALGASQTSLDERLLRALKGTQAVIDSDAALQQKLELTLPIIPMLLEYKFEIGAGSGVDLDEILKRLRQRWTLLTSKTRKSRGQG